MPAAVTRLLPFLLLIGLAVYALVDCIQTPDDKVRNLPKIGWIVLIVVVPLAIGPAAWLIAGRPRRSAEQPGRPWPAGGYPRSAGTRVLAPDDDPEFLAGLGRRRPEPDPEPERTEPTHPNEISDGGPDPRLAEWERELRSEDRDEDGPGRDAPA